jgi:hypothetical protein
VDVNLDSLKHEVLQHLEDSDFALFRSSPGGLDRLQMVLWNVEQYPDYRMFLDAAHKAGAKVLIFGTDELESSDLDDLREQMEDLELSRDERRDFESRLRALAKYEGRTCTLEMAFSLEGRMYVYDVQPDWYDEFVQLEDEILARLTDDDDLDDDTLGGYYSKN